MQSICKIELEEVSGHERNLHQTKRQRLIPSPLQTNERLLENTGRWCQSENDITQGVTLEAEEPPT